MKLGQAKRSRGETQEEESVQAEKSAARAGVVHEDPEFPPGLGDELEAQELERRAERAREEAFSREPRWDGRRLYPFSIDRESLFFEIRSAMRAPSLAEVLNGPDARRAFLPDALRIVWLCLVPAAARDAREEDAGGPFLLDLREEGMKAIQGEIDGWAREKLVREDLPVLVALGLTLLGDSRVNRAEPMPSGKPAGAEDGLGE